MYVELHWSERIKGIDGEREVDRNRQNHLQVFWRTTFVNLRVHAVEVRCSSTQRDYCQLEIDKNAFCILRYTGYSQSSTSIDISPSSSGSSSGTEGSRLIRLRDFKRGGVLLSACVKTLSNGSKSSEFRAMALIDIPVFLPRAKSSAWKGTWGRCEPLGTTLLRLGCEDIPLKHIQNC